MKNKLDVKKRGVATLSTLAMLIAMPLVNGLAATIIGTFWVVIIVWMASPPDGAPCHEEYITGDHRWSK